MQMGRRGKRGRTTNGNTTVILARKNKEVFLLVLSIEMVGSYLRLNQDKAITPFTSLTILTYLAFVTGYFNDKLTSFHWVIFHHVCHGCQYSTSPFSFMVALHLEVLTAELSKYCFQKLTKYEYE